MKKAEFFETVKDGVLENLRDNDPTLDGAIQQVIKINNVVFHGLSVRSDNNHVTPMIYLDDFFDKFSSEDFSINDIVDQVTKAYKHSLTCAQDIDIGNITDYDSVKSRIIPAVCNLVRSSEYLKNVYFEEYCDLAVYYRILIDINDGEGSVLLNSQLLDNWNVSFEELKTQAWKNLHQISPPVFSKMFDILREMMPEISESDLVNSIDTCIHILSNKTRFNGSVYIADTAVLNQIADKLNTDIIILPSSRHELIVLPYSMATEPNRWAEMAAMVTEINHNGTVSDEDYLADSVYYYTRDSGIVRKIA